MAAIHVARGATDRDMIIKIEGSYDGHHDAVMVCCYPELDELGPLREPEPASPSARATRRRWSS